jgi:chorismate synthase
MDPTSSIDYELSPPEEYKPKWEKWWSALKTVTRTQVDSNLVRCPDEETAELMKTRIIQAKDDANSIGGVVTCVCQSVFLMCARL